MFMDMTYILELVDQCILFVASKLPKFDMLAHVQCSSLCFCFWTWSRLWKLTLDSEGFATKSQRINGINALHPSFSIIDGLMSI